MEGLDFDLAREVGVDAMFAPSIEEMYDQGDTRVTASSVSQRWEGEHRQGHFDGVATVVAKLFNIIRPTDAFFGLKDLQQCAVIQALIRDLNYPITLRLMETVRENDGLAMSSRNAKLSPDERAIAPQLHSTLTELALAIRNGTLLSHALLQGRQSLVRVGFAVQYLALVDANSLEPIQACDEGARLIVAASLGNTRLIDNIAVR
jgi:pantoate--beta-alanine ligase